MDSTKQYRTLGRLKRLARWELPVILTAALIGLTGEALGLPLESSLAAALTWQLLAAAVFVLAPRRG